MQVILNKKYLQFQIKEKQIKKDKEIEQKRKLDLMDAN